MKFKRLLLSVIAGAFLGSVCLGNSCSAMMQMDHSIIAAQQISPRFANFMRTSRHGFADRINPEHKPANYYNQKCRCSNCGWIGFPRCRGNSYCCGGCQRGGGVGDGLLFQIFNGNPTTRFGICPYSNAGNPHFGFIHDMRIVRQGPNVRYRGLNRNQLRHDNRTVHCCFYCYECVKNVAVPLNTLG